MVSPSCELTVEHPKLVVILQPAWRINSVVVDKHCPFAHFRKERRIKALRGKVSDNSDNLSSDGQLQGRLRAVFEIARGHAWKLVQSGPPLNKGWLVFMMVILKEQQNAPLPSNY